MKVILTKDVPSLGKRQDIVDVKPGYANNMLFKNGLAVKANDANKKLLEEQIEQERIHRLEIKENAEIVKKLVDGKTFKFSVKVGPEGQLYGKITNKDIADAINAKHNTQIDKRKIEIDEDIKHVGTHHVIINLHTEVTSTVKIKVESE